MTWSRSCSSWASTRRRADWVKSTYITDDTETLAAKLDERAIAATVEYAKQSTRFDGLQLDPVTARKIKLLKLSLTIATPSDPKESEELTRIVAGMEGAYGKGKYCPSGPASCKDLEDLSKILAESRDPKQLLEAWTGWHAIARPMRQGFRALRGAGEQGRAASSASRITAPCGGPSTTCRRTLSPPNSTGCGNRCGRCICRCTPTCAPG